MADSGLAYDPDRLPWLTEDRKPRRKRAAPPLLLWAVLAGLLVAGLSYWLGMQSAVAPDDFADTAPASPRAATVTLPEPARVEPRALEVQPVPAPDVRPVAEPEVRIAAAEPERIAKPPPRKRPSAKAKSRSITSKARARSAPVRKRAAAKRPAAMQAWPAAVSQGAYGRVVRIGAFSSRRQAKQGWWAIVRHYPGMKRLKAVVAPVPSLRDGRTYYRLQFGTTSQAHSEVLCQRMRFIAQSCVVVGLPAARGTRR